MLSIKRAIFAPIFSKTKNAKLLSMEVVVACLIIRLSVFMGPVL